MKTKLAVAALTLLLCGGLSAQQEDTPGPAKIQPGIATPSALQIRTLIRQVSPP